MTQYQITLDPQTLQRLFSGESQLGQLLEAVLNQVLEAQVSEQLQAARYERTDERQGYRNGYKPRRLTTRVGRLALRVPQVREGRVDRALRPLPTQRTGAHPDAHGDGRQRRLDAEGGTHYRGVVWDELRKVDGVRPVQGPGSAGTGVE